MKLSPQALDMLKFYVDCGADEFIEDSPLNRFVIEREILKDSLVIELPKTQTHIVPKIGTIEALKDIEAELQNINNLEALKQFLESSEAYSLKRTAANTIFAEGVANAKVMLIGDSPSADEDIAGRAFVGKSGAMLDKMLAAIGLSREENIYLTYMINWYPPGNRLPNDAEISLSLPVIKKHIELINPEIIICLGDITAKRLLQTTQSITRVHGKWHEYYIEEIAKKIPSIAIFRPEYLMASPSQKAKAWEDLLKIKARMQELGLV